VGHPAEKHAWTAMTDRLPFQATLAARPYDALKPLPVTILLDNVRSVYNVGAFFRTADGVALARLCMTGITATPPQNGIRKTALGAEEAVPWERWDDPLAEIRSLREREFEVAVIETSVHAVDLFDWRPRFPVCLIFGHEVDGVRPELAALADTHVRLPMLGTKHSLNVATAGGVVMYELLRKWRALRESAG
jgi:23S rRNA (guanosine2251-2'-O)-methyltransferase